MASGVSLHGSQPAANQASADTTRLRTPNLRLNLQQQQQQQQQQQLCSPGTSAGGYGLDQRPQSPSSLITALQMHRLRLRGDSPIPPGAQSPGVSVLSAPLARMQVGTTVRGGPGSHSLVLFCLGVSIRHALRRHQLRVRVKIMGSIIIRTD
jgi:hypothetical protein